MGTQSPGRGRVPATLMAPAILPQGHVATHISSLGAQRTPEEVAASPLPSLSAPKTGFTPREAGPRSVPGFAPDRMGLAD